MPTRQSALEALAEQEFDLLVVGAGIFGACAACDAAQRGLRVALLDRGDFGAATSAHSYKLIHGGIRYLQHGDLWRVRESSLARRAFLRVAPELVRPLPILVPTYRMGKKSRWLMRLANWIYDLTTWDRNAGQNRADRRVPAGKTLGREQVLEAYPWLPRQNLTGGVIFHDAQMLDPPRLTLAFVQAAQRYETTAANYVEAVKLRQKENRVVGVEARDRFTEQSLFVRARVVLNAAGPQAMQLRPTPPLTNIPWTRDCALVLRRRLTVAGQGLALACQTHDPDAWLSRGGRHLFLAPWRGRTLLGVWHRVQSPQQPFHLTEEEIVGFLDEVNRSHPSLELSRDQVLLYHSGLVPTGDNRPATKNVRFGHRSYLLDHQKTDGLEGLLSLVGVRYTTAIREAPRAVNLAFQKLLRTAPVSRLDSEPLEAEATPSFSTQQVRHAVQHEMAQTLADVMLRRTELGTTSELTLEALASSAAEMAPLLSWSDERVQQEIDGLLPSQAGE